MCEFIDDLASVFPLASCSLHGGQLGSGKIFRRWRCVRLAGTKSGSAMTRQGTQNGDSAGCVVIAPPSSPAVNSASLSVTSGADGLPRPGLSDSANHQTI
jgi:hypothetical protein